MGTHAHYLLYNQGYFEGSFSQLGDHLRKPQKLDPLKFPTVRYGMKVEEFEKLSILRCPGHSYLYRVYQLYDDGSHQGEQQLVNSVLLLLLAVVI